MKKKSKKSNPKYLTEEKLDELFKSQLDVDAFLDTALGSTSSFDSDGFLDDTYSISDVSEEFRKTCEKVLAKFEQKAWHLFFEEEIDADKIEHDLWLTMHGHGAGFWDGDYEHGDELTKIAKSFNELEDQLRDSLHSEEDMKKSNPSKKESDWQVYKSLKGSYAYLESPKHPFYNVKIHKEKDGFVCVLGDGYREYSEKSFKSFKDATTYGEKEYKKLLSKKSNPSKSKREHIETIELDNWFHCADIYKCGHGDYEYEFSGYSQGGPANGSETTLRGAIKAAKEEFKNYEEYVENIDLDEHDEE